ncbi:solute carrier family 35 member F6-like isoform X2 [Portunus trituberculatus]|uniref:solute carrier family 35 member F6-like isoform X2 n=1 Tax=Portunus trituberculatus TaxID=210409 RepID=UPI001E1D10D7|nr:solute carrier family 35 member F6-like isoform X2 [Portunus trituberculatus]
MAWTKKQMMLAFIMVSTGSINTISAKWTDRIYSKNSHGNVVKFNHPFLQADCMFMGEMTCMAAFYILRILRRRARQGASELALDSDQMLRGAVIVFTGLLSVGFLGRRLRYFHWLGIVLVLIGLVVVGLSDFISSSQTNQDLNGIITGDLLIIMAQIVTATQMVIEERFVIKHNVPPLLAVGWEGTFGFLTLSVLLVPMYYIPAGKLSGNENGTLEDAIDAFVQIGNSALLALSLLMNIVSIAFFNFAGISVTKELSATTRMVLDSVRTFVIWVFTLLVQWETFQYLQPIGFVILMLGMMLYNDVIILPFLRSCGVIQDQRVPETIPVLEGVDEVDKGSTYGGTVDPF